MSKVIQDSIDEEIFRLENSPEELAKIEKFIESIGSEQKIIYSRVTRKVFHDFSQVCKIEDVSVGEKMRELITEYSKKDYLEKKVYNPALDYKSLQARNYD